MDGDQRQKTSPMATKKPSMTQPSAVTATSITELLNSRSGINNNSLNASTPSLSTTTMTTFIPHSTDVVTPCTSNHSMNANHFRSSPFADSNKPVPVPFTTAPIAPSASAMLISNANVGGGGGACKPMANNQNTSLYHSQIRQTLDQQSGGTVAVRGKTDPAMAPYICAKCGQKIVDRYLLEALDKYWHEDCLKCDACDGRLGELGSKLYFKNNNILCQRDYLRIFRPTGTCAACTKTIPAFEQVMRAGANVYHLECFACQECNHRFCIGDKFYLDVDHNKILCEYDYEERMVFAQMAYNYNSLAQLKRQISQQVDDFDEVQSIPPR